MKIIKNLEFRIKNYEGGFTLIELIIVIGILSIITAGALAVLNPVAQVQKANDAKRKANLAQIQRALEVYYQDNGKYPSASADHRIVGLDGNAINWGFSWQPYMNVLPSDPDSSRRYVYSSSGDRQAYYLYASLDRKNDPGACNGGNPCINLVSNGFSYTACGKNEDKVCNFGVTSPNVSP